MITYRPVMKPELVTVVNIRPTCCRLIPSDRARPMKMPPSNMPRFSGCFTAGRGRISSSGSRMMAPSAKRRPV
ncbi:hypothetical protein D3C80_2111060 [compost metagenome]